MDVIVDGERNFRFEGKPSDMLAAVGAVGEFLHARGRGLQSVEVDGKSFLPEDITLLEGMALDAVSLLEITSEALDKLIGECISEIEAVVPELPSLCHALAEVFQGETPAEGYDPFHKLAEIWEHVKAREMQVASALNLDWHATTLGGVPIERLHGALNTYLEEALEALKSGDCILLGDLLEYELAPRAEMEGQIIDLLKNKAQLQTPS